MPIKIRDVAAAVGVSSATVSRVLNGRDYVAADVRERVLAAVAELGYRPNATARSLRTRVTQVIGVMVSDITNPFFTAVVRGVEDTAQQAGYSVVLANTDEDPAKEASYFDVAVAEQLAGVILAPTSSRATNIDALAAQGIPVVTLDRRLRSKTVDSVTVDNHRAALEATAHLLDQGCRRIGIIAGPAQTTTGARRLAGYRAALRAAGIAVDARHIVRADFRIDGGYHAAKKLLALTPPIDGLFVSNNLMTIGALQALAEAGRRMPDDIATVGFDEANWSTALWPPLTVVAQPTHDIGRHAAELLISRIRGETQPPRHVVLPANLLVRASSSVSGPPA